MAPYERLEAWKLCHRLVLSVYRATRGFPPEERYGLTAQCRRAAVSAAANIVEGSAKRGRREFRRFLSIAFASLTELGYLLRVAGDLGFLDAAPEEELRLIHTSASRLTWKLYESMGRRD